MVVVMVDRLRSCSLPKALYVTDATEQESQKASQQTRRTSWNPEPKSSSVSYTISKSARLITSNPFSTTPSVWHVETCEQFPHVHSVVHRDAKYQLLTRLALLSSCSIHRDCTNRPSTRLGLESIFGKLAPREYRYYLLQRAAAQSGASEFAIEN